MIICTTCGRDWDGPTAARRYWAHVCPRVIAEVAR